MGFRYGTLGSSYELDVMPFAFLGVYDTTVHISEEAANPRTAVPFSIVSSIVISGVVGWGMSTRDLYL